MDKLQDIGRGAYAALVEMVDALNVDYDRLTELNNAEDDNMAEDDRDELRELQDAAGNCDDREDAERRIQENALSVEVRSGWYTPGGDYPGAAEFNILLTTGGPAVRIRGTLNDYGEPGRAWLEVQDWGTPWTQYNGASQETLLAYARCFYFGE